MAFLIQCDQKGCHEYQEPVIDTETNKVYCTSCEKEINNVTYFAKVQLKALGQIKRASRKQQSFAVRCNACSTEAQPVLTEGKLFCVNCGEELQLSKPFAKTVIEYLRGK